jgi:predicted dithiol-disulfide oxidoreductase (DUF899 family)
VANRSGFRLPLDVLGCGRLQLRFHVSFTEEQQRDGTVEHNFQREPTEGDVFRWSPDGEGGGDAAEDDARGHVRRRRTHVPSRSARA